MKFIEKPTLIVDTEKASRNIVRMVKKARKADVKLRPHFKTHQSAEIAKIFRDFKINKATVSSISMAQYFARHDWQDITIAFPFNYHELLKIVSMAEKINLNILIASPEAAIKLTESNIFKCGVYIKIDVGYHRSGLEYNDLQNIDKTISILENSKALNFKGFLCHFGNTYSASNKEEVLNIFTESMQRAQTLKEKYATLLPDIELSIGDTPSCSISDTFEGADEIRPGNFVFYDIMQENIGSCSFEDIAVALACPIVDIHPSRNEFVIYGGAVHLSKEYIIDKDGDKSFGRVVSFNDSSWKLPSDKIYISSLSQEHGVIKATDSFIKSAHIGDIIGVLPVHSCLAADIAMEYRTLDNQIIKKFNSSE